MTADVFISYSKQDRATAERICRILEANGVPCWIAFRNVPQGASWPAAIAHAIEEAKAFVVVLSPHANASPYVVTEVNLAFAQRKSLFVFRTDDILPVEDLQFFLASHQWTDGFPPPLDDRVAGMAQALRLLLAKDSLKPLQDVPRRGREPLPRDDRPAAPVRVRPIPGAGRPASLPTPAEPAAESDGSRTEPSRAFAESRHRDSFSAGGRLQTSAFDFPIDSALLRAARRRNDQGRAQATIADLIAGLLRTGGLTRLVMTRTGRDPDALYHALRAVPEEGKAFGFADTSSEDAINDGTAPDVTLLQALLARWLLADRRDFVDELVLLLERLGQLADGPITELALLEAIIATPAWTASGVPLPEPDEVRAELDEGGRSREVDANGAVPLHDLTPAARRIVHRAHRLSQQCQAPAITHRLLFAALVEESDGYAARVCRSAGVDTALLLGLLVTISAAGDSSEQAAAANVILSPDVCARVATPVLREARQRARSPRAITEEELFRAFCKAADTAFVEFIRARSTLTELEPTEADLRELGTLDPDRPGRLDRLTLRARGIVTWAHATAQQIGARSISNRLMLASFLAHESAHARHAMLTSSAPPDELFRVVMASVPQAAAITFELDEQACARIVTPVLEWARHLPDADGPVTEALLFRAFCEVSDIGFKAALRNAGVDLDAHATAGPTITSTRRGRPN